LFLTEIELFQSINDILSWLENHSGIIGIITAIIAGSLWFHKFLMQKRAEAFFGFYARLLLQIKSLQALLDDNELLVINKPSVGNIYTLIYSGDPYKVCNDFKIPSEELFDDLKRLALQIKNTLTESENNVYPKVSERSKWYDSQYILFEFCEFLEYKSKRGITNIAKVAGKYKHTVKCQDLINAMKYIKESIEKEITDNKH